MGMGLEWTVNGRNVSLQEFEEELQHSMAESALKQAQVLFADKARYLRCPVHRMRPTVRVEGRQLRNVSLRIRGCCKEFVQQVKEQLQNQAADLASNATATIPSSNNNRIMNQQEFTNRRRFAERQDFQDATPRILKFIAWIEDDPEGQKILHHLREGMDVESLIKNAGFQHPPQPGTPEEVAAIALCAIDSAKARNTQLFQISMALGVRGSSSKIQDTQDEFESRYLSPFFDYLEDQLFASDGVAVVRPVAMNTKQVFVVHGRDEQIKDSTARFISTLGLEPIILHEQPNKGRTIIEKFEQCADVGFAVILLTPDDVGGLQGMEAKPRARQNVIFELGYFLGRLGRGRVAALYKGENMDLPSDYAGVLFTSFDAHGAWKFELVRELKAAGFDVDANHAL